jgi:hypothetical protein
LATHLQIDTNHVLRKSRLFDLSELKINRNCDICEEYAKKLNLISLCEMERNIFLYDFLLDVYKQNIIYFYLDQFKTSPANDFFSFFEEKLGIPGPIRWLLDRVDNVLKIETSKRAEWFERINKIVQCLSKRKICVVIFGNTNCIKDDIVTVLRYLLKKADFVIISSTSMKTEVSFLKGLSGIYDYRLPRISYFDSLKYLDGMLKRAQIRYLGKEYDTAELEYLVQDRVDRILFYQKNEALFDIYFTSGGKYSNVEKVLSLVNTTKDSKERIYENKDICKNLLPNIDSIDKTQLHLAYIVSIFPFSIHHEDLHQFCTQLGLDSREAIGSMLNAELLFETSKERYCNVIRELNLLIYHFKSVKPRGWEEMCKEYITDDPSRNIIYNNEKMSTLKKALIERSLEQRFHNSIGYYLPKEWKNAISQLVDKKDKVEMTLLAHKFYSKRYIEKRVIFLRLCELYCEQNLLNLSVNSDFILDRRGLGEKVKDCINEYQKEMSQGNSKPDYNVYHSVLLNKKMEKELSADDYMVNVIYCFSSLFGVDYPLTIFTNPSDPNNEYDFW